MNAILYVAATGCQWRALPEVYPNWSTVHSYHLRWSRDGTWESIVDRLRQLVRQAEGHPSDPSVGIIDARSVRGASTVTRPSRGYDAGKKISGRKCFGIVDTFGLLLAVVVVAASTSDNTGGMACFADSPCPSRPDGRRCSATAGSRRSSKPVSAPITSPPRSSTESIPAASRSCPNGGSWNEHVLAHE